MSFDDVASLFDAVVSLDKSGILNKTYLSDTIPLSNTYENIYSYSCSLTSPFALEDNGDYFQTHIGLNGADGTSLSYKVTVSSSHRDNWSLRKCGELFEAQKIVVCVLWLSCDCFRHFYANKSI